MSFIDTSKLKIVERRPGWLGRFFDSGVMTFRHYEFAKGADIHAHSHEQEEVWEVIEGELAVTIAGLPVILGLVFYGSERSLRGWLGGKLDRDIDMLNMIAHGEFHKTRTGAYLMSLNDLFPAEIRGDMLCLLQLTIELSVRAKSDLLFREVGLEVAPDPELDSQLKELKYLEKNIGPTGMLAVRPLLSQTPRDLWEMHRLSQARL